MGRPLSRAGRLDPQAEKRFLSGAREAGRFFLNKSNVHRALERLADRLQELKIPYAIVGVLSLNAYGYPASAAVRGERFALLPLSNLIELKLASGMTAPHRLRDLADVIELIRQNALAEGFSESLHPYVREKFRELWQAAQTGDDD